MPNFEVQQVTTAPGLVQKVIMTFRRFTTSPKRTATTQAVNSASETNPEAMPADIAAPHSTNIAAQHSTTEEFNATPSVTNKQTSGEPASQTNAEAMSLGSKQMPPQTSNL